MLVIRENEYYGEQRRTHLLLEEEIVHIQRDQTGSQDKDPYGFGHGRIEPSSARDLEWRPTTLGFIIVVWV